MQGTLFLLPNVLGYSEDLGSEQLLAMIPATVLNTTASLDYLIAENAKTTRAFLKRIAPLYPLGKPLQEIRIAELNVNTASDALPELLVPIMQGQNGGLISEAGVPAVADPGANLVRLAHLENVRVKPLVGPSSILLAVMAGGLNGQSFAFNGYLPTDIQQRTKRIKALEERSRADKQTQLFIETPYRNQALLESLVSTCRNDTLISIATDLTLPSESIETLSAGQWKQRLTEKKMPDFHKKPTVFSLLAA
ncbi:MAG: SAM-dependent methyltransferase [Burkholderiaceae bacterium]